MSAGTDITTFRKESADVMTINEASERYQIPLKILKEYESWGLCGAVNLEFCEQSVKNTDGNEMALDMELAPEYILGVIFLVWRGDMDYE